MTELNFSYNWNNKLHCNYFTTIRRHNVHRKVNSEVLVRLNKYPFCKGEIIDIKTCMLIDLPEYTCYLDTGYSKPETIEILKKMYHLENEDVSFDIILIKKIK